MIDAHIPHLHQKSGNRSCFAMLLQNEKIFLSDFTIFLTFFFTSRPFFIFLFCSHYFKKLFFHFDEFTLSFPLHNFIKCLMAHFNEWLYDNIKDYLLAPLKIHYLYLSLSLFQSFFYHLGNHYRFNHHHNLFSYQANNNKLHKMLLQRDSCNLKKLFIEKIKAHNRKYIDG